MKLAALVPMRHVSERVPGKNYRILGDRPLFAHVIDTLLSCPSIDEVLIDTDSPSVVEASGQRYGNAVTILDRPIHLRGGQTPMNDVLRYDAYRVNADVFVQTHSTNPFLQRTTIERAIECYSSGGDHDTLFGVTRVQARLYWEDGRPINHDPTNLARTQDLLPVYLDNSCLYIYDRETILTTSDRLGSKPQMFEIPPIEDFDIDEETDFTLAQFIWRGMRESSPR